MMNPGIAQMRGQGYQVFHFSPEANVGDGTVPESVSIPALEADQVPSEEEKPSSATQTSTTSGSTTH